MWPGRDKEATMLGWVGDIERLTLENSNFRTVVYTSGHTQLTVMSIPPGGEVGWESHGHLDQFLRIEKGQARLDLGHEEDSVDESHELGEDWAVIVPAGIWHNVVNLGDTEIRLYSLYSPPEHPAGTIHKTKADADADEH
jgi:mannose-6-phosphate isomerase-like protein (cupin superfamily)